MAKDLDQTMQFKMDAPEKDKVVDIMEKVYHALKEKGYDPSNQIIGYIISGDPTYVTSHNDARKLIKHLDRNDLLESILKFYFEKNDIK